MANTFKKTPLTKVETDYTRKYKTQDNTTLGTKKFTFKESNPYIVKSGIQTVDLIQPDKYTNQLETQRNNLQTRLAAANQTYDPRNVIQKALGLDQGQGLVTGTLDLLSRPLDTLKSAVSYSINGDTSGYSSLGSAIWNGGIQGGARDLSWVNALGMDNAQLDGMSTFMIDFGLDMFADPLNFVPPATIVNAMKGAGKAVGGALDTIAKTMLSEEHYNKIRQSWVDTVNWFGKRFKAGFGMSPELQEKVSSINNLRTSWENKIYPLIVETNNSLTKGARGLETYLKTGKIDANDLDWIVTYAKENNLDPHKVLEEHLAELGHKDWSTDFDRFAKENYGVKEAGELRETKIDYWMSSEENKLAAMNYLRKTTDDVDLVARAEGEVTNDLLESLIRTHLDEIHDFHMSLRDRMLNKGDIFETMYNTLGSLWATAMNDGHGIGEILPRTLNNLLDALGNIDGAFLATDNLEQVADVIAQVSSAILQNPVNANDVLKQMIVVDDNVAKEIKAKYDAILSDINDSKGKIYNEAQRNLDIYTKSLAARYKEELDNFEETVVQDAEKNYNKEIQVLLDKEVKANKKVQELGGQARNFDNLPPFEDWAPENNVPLEVRDASHLFNPNSKRSRVDSVLTGISNDYYRWMTDENFSKEYAKSLRYNASTLEKVMYGDLDVGSTALKKFQQKIGHQLFPNKKPQELTSAEHAIIGSYVNFHDRMINLARNYSISESPLKYLLHQANSPDFIEKMGDLLFDSASSAYDEVIRGGHPDYELFLTKWNHPYPSTYSLDIAKEYKDLVEAERAKYLNNPQWQFWNAQSQSRNEILREISKGKGPLTIDVPHEIPQFVKYQANTLAPKDFLEWIDNYDFGEFKNAGERLKERLTKESTVEDKTIRIKYTNKKSGKVVYRDELLAREFEAFKKEYPEATTLEEVEQGLITQTPSENNKIIIEERQEWIKKQTKKLKELEEKYENAPQAKLYSLSQEITRTRELIQRFSNELSKAQQSTNLKQIWDSYIQDGFEKIWEERTAKGGTEVDSWDPSITYTAKEGGWVVGHDVTVNSIRQLERISPDDVNAKEKIQDAVRQFMKEPGTSTKMNISKELQETIKKRSQYNIDRRTLHFRTDSVYVRVRNKIKNNKEWQRLNKIKDDAWNDFKNSKATVNQERRDAEIAYAKEHGVTYDYNRLADDAISPFIVTPTRNRKYENYEQLVKNAHGGIETKRLQEFMLANPGYGYTIKINPNHEWWNSNEAEKGIYAQMSQGIISDLKNKAQEDAFAEIANGDISEELLMARQELATGDYDNLEDAFVDQYGKDLTLEEFKSVFGQTGEKLLAERSPKYLEEYLRQTIQLPQNIKTPGSALIPETFARQMHAFMVELTEMANSLGVDREAFINNVFVKHAVNPQQMNLIRQIGLVRGKSVSAAVDTENGAKASLKGQSAGKYSARFGLYADQVNNYLQGWDYFSPNSVWTMAQMLRMQPDEFSFYAIIRAGFDTGAIRKLTMPEALKAAEVGLRKNPNIGRTYIEGKELREKMNMYLHIVPLDEFEQVRTLFDPLLNSKNSDVFEVPIGFYDMISRPAQTETVGNSITSLVGGFIKNWKTSLLFTPGYHIRNVVSNFANAWSAGINPIEYSTEYPKALADVNELQRQIKTASKLRIEHLDNYNFSGDKNEYKRFWKEVVCENNEARYNLWNEYMDLTRRGIVNQTKISSDFFDMSADLAKLSKKQNWAKKEFEQVLNTNVLFGQITDDAARLAAHRIVSKNPEIIRRMGLKDADSFIRTVFFDFNAMTEFEKRTMRKWIPFYTWMKKNLEFQMKALMNNPGRLTRFSKAINALYNAQDIDPTTIPEWVTDQMYIPVRSGDKLRLMKFSLPVLDFIDIGNLKLLSRFNPFFKTALETMTGVDLFTNRNTNMFKSAYTNLLSPFTRLLAAPFDIPLGQIPMGGGKTFGALVGQDYDLISKNSLYFTESITKLRRSYLWEQINSYQDYIQLLQNGGAYIPTITELTAQATSPKYNVENPIGTYNIRKIRVPKY